MPDLFDQIAPSPPDVFDQIESSGATRSSDGVLRTMPVIPQQNLKFFLNGANIAQQGQADVVGDQQQAIAGRAVSQLNTTTQKALFTPIVDYLPENIKQGFDPSYQIAGPQKGQMLPTAQPIALPAPVPSKFGVQNNPADLGAFIGATRGLLNTAKGFTSPAALLTAPAIGEEGGAKLLSAVLAPQMLPAVGQAATDLGTQMGLPSKQRDSSKISQALTEGGVASLFTLLAGTHAAAPERPSMPAAPDVFDQVEQQIKTPPTKSQQAIKDFQDRQQAVSLGQAEVDPNSPFARGKVMPNQSVPTPPPPSSLSSSSADSVNASAKNPLKETSASTLATSEQGVPTATDSTSLPPVKPEDLTNVQHDLKNVASTITMNKGLGRLSPEQVANLQQQGDAIYGRLVQDNNLEAARFNIQQLQKQVNRNAASNVPATPEDIAAYKKAESDLATLMPTIAKGGDEGKAAQTQLSQAFVDRENIKNKYGGMPPRAATEIPSYVPKPEPSNEPASVATASLASLASDLPNVQSTNAGEAGGGQPNVQQSTSEPLQEESRPKEQASVSPSSNGRAGRGRTGGDSGEGVRSLNKDIAAALSKRRGEAGFFRMVKPEFFDKLGFKKDAPVDSQQLGNRIRNSLGEKSGTWDFLASSGFGDWLKANPKVSVQQAEKWVEENKPKVEVRKFGVVGQDIGTKRLFDITHQIDTSFKDYAINGSDGSVIHYGIGDHTTILKPDAIPDPKLRELMLEYKDLQSKRNLDVTEHAHWQSIAPKSEQDMPGYVELAVVKPTKEAPNLPSKYSDEYNSALADRQRGVQFPSSHNFPPNTLGFVRGYMEHRADGGKTFHVIEVQSDWAQRVRDEKERFKGYEPDSAADQVIKGLDNPLLSHYERLALKAAIEHARSEGADRIAVSDAETAMMTEGHDRGATQGGHLTIEHPDLMLSSKERSNIGWKVSNKETGEVKTFPSMEGAESYARSQEKVEQAPGMRLHYDRTLPKILGELTGEEGKRVEFGEHKMAFDERPLNTVDERGQFYQTERVVPRKNLIFRNSNGTPKTSVTARGYSLARANKTEDFTAFGTDKPEAASRPVQSLNRTGSQGFTSESGALNGKIIQEFIDKVKNKLRPSDLAREVFSASNMNAARLAFMGHDVPHTLQHGEGLADALVKAAGADTASRLEARSMVSDVLGDYSKGDQFRKQFGAALYEDMRKAYMRDNPGAQTTPVLDVRSTPFADELQRRSFMELSEVKDMIQKHKDTVQKLAQEQHVKLGGKLSATGKETGAFLNLKAVLDEPTPASENPGTVSKGQLSTLKKGSAFTKQRSFTGSDYDFDYRTLAERMVQKNYAEAAKQAFYDKLESTGVGKVLKAGEGIPNGMVSVPIQRKMLSIAKPGEPSVWVNHNQNIAVPKDMAAEVRQAFQTDSPIQNSALRLFNEVITKVQVAAGVDAFAHTISDISGVATVIRSKFGKNVFPLGAIDTVSKLWKNGARVIHDSPDIQREIASMAKNGVTFRNRQGGSLSATVLRFVDTVSRVSLNQIFDQGVKDGPFKDSAENRRTFINGHLGQYNPRLMTRLQQGMQESGVSPFIVAGKNFNRLAVKQVTGMTGVEATSYGEQAKLKLYKAAGLVTAGVVAPLLLNKYFTGSYTGTPGTKAGEIDFGKKDKEGNEMRYDMAKLLMLRRGMRVTGTEGLVEGQVMPRLRGEQPEPISHSLKRGALDAAKGAAMPYVGPAPNAASTFFTGKSVLGYDNREAGDNFPYVRATAKAANPMLGAGAEGYDKGSAGGEIGKTFGKMAGMTFRNQSGVVRNLARTYTIQQGKAGDDSFAPSPYIPLVNAIKVGNPTQAQAIYNKLLQDKSPKEIETYFQKYANRPYTWSQQGDEAFQATLTPAQQKLYDASREEDQSVAEKFFDAFSNRAFKMPRPRRPARDAE